MVSVEALDDEAFASAFGEREQSLILSSPILMGASVVFGRQVLDGSMIDAVSPVWFELVRRLKGDPDYAFRMSPQQWEEMIAAAYKQAGYDEVILTPRSGDLGRDVIAIKRDFATVRVVNQMKRYAAGRVVTADEVRALYGVMRLDGASKAVLTTTAQFAPRLRDDRLLKAVIPSELELVDKDTLIPSLVQIAGRAA